MKLNDALTIAAGLLSAVVTARQQQREILTETDLDKIAAIDDAAMDRLQDAIDRQRSAAQ